MKCAICRNGEARLGKATVTLEREGLILVVKGVPARVCENCGEGYVAEAEATRLSTSADEALRAGVKVEVREYVAA
ncbi:MAG: type II toxin-antitoxin system MqsA family antitoxin [Alphaproteobacteria bacterium]|nr:type II toxin-antitoxin system MqsA family antitoxin [Alphaproteobacteria bacterium]